MQRSGLRGCDSCSALVYLEDAFCPTCGAGVQEAELAGGTVRIPIRRHGIVPPIPEHAWTPATDETHGVRGAVVAVIVSLATAGAAAAAIYRFW